MANFSLDGVASISFMNADGEWIELGSGKFEQSAPEPHAEPQEIYNYSALVGRTFTIKGKFKFSPDFTGILVGMLLKYNLRQLHRNLGRYSSWHYTN